MTDEEKLNESKIALQKKRKPSNKILDFMIDLADSRYLPAKSFFVDLLDEKNYEWRLEGMSALYYYDLSSNELEKVRKILMNDSDGGIRIRAAGVLGLKSKWPDLALREAIEKDKDRHVRIGAVKAVLYLVQVPVPTVNKEIGRMESGEIEPSFAEIERITQELSDSRNNR